MTCAILMALIETPILQLKMGLEVVPRLEGLRDLS